MISNKISVELDNQSQLDSMLNDLSSGRLAQRIAEAAHLAAARAMYQAAQEMQSVEAEYSTK